MNRQETTQIITLLAGNYINISEKTKEQKQLMINTWQECLGDLDYNLVLHAVKKTIIESPYPPTIHEVRKNAIEFVNPATQKTGIEAWNEAIKMISNGLYMTEEQFNNYSPEVKRFFGSVNQVRQLAMVDMETINTVTKGQFLKQYDILVQRDREEKLLPAPMKEVIEGLANKWESNTNRFGEKTEYKRYYLADIIANNMEHIPRLD